MRRFQFTIRGLLFATFWVAVGFAVWYYPAGQLPLWDSYSLDFVGIAACVSFVCLLMATGALMGWGRLILLTLIAVAGVSVIVCLFVVLKANKLI